MEMVEGESVLLLMSHTNLKNWGDRSWHYSQLHNFTIKLKPEFYNRFTNNMDYVRNFDKFSNNVDFASIYI